MIDIMDSDSPTVLYKYKDVSEDAIRHVEDMLRNNRLWFSSPKAFTDPFDCRCVYDIRNTREEVVLGKMRFLTRKGASLSDALAQAEQDIPRSTSELEEWLEQQIKGHSYRAANTGILCLTRFCDNPIMWTHFAKGHTGICIMFRVPDVRKDSHIDFIASALPVEYVDCCPLINFARDEIVSRSFKKHS